MHHSDPQESKPIKQSNSWAFVRIPGLALLDEIFPWSTTIIIKDFFDRNRWGKRKCRYNSLPDGQAIETLREWNGFVPRLTLRSLWRQARLDHEKMVLETPEVLWNIASWRHRQRLTWDKMDPERCQASAAHNGETARDRQRPKPKGSTSECHLRYHVKRTPLQDEKVH